MNIFRSALHWAIAKLGIRDAVLLQVTAAIVSFLQCDTITPHFFPQRLCAATISAASGLDSMGVSNVRPYPSIP
jgi:hypothetical protein